MTDKLRDAAQQSEWRRLALQFDYHRMQALSHIRAMLASPSDHAPIAAEFLNQPPLDGEKVLAERIAALAQQDAQAVPMGYKLVPVEPTPEMVDAVCDDVGLCDADKADEDIRVEYRVAYRAMLAAAPTPPGQQDAQAVPQPSPTAGMNIAQRILHVGGRNNAAGYVEFGSIQAVEALVRQVIRDLPELVELENLRHNVKVYREATALTLNAASAAARSTQMDWADGHRRLLRDHGSR